MGSSGDPLGRRRDAMDLAGYVERIKAARDAADLERIRAEALRDSDLDDVDKTIVSGRVGSYLADHDRERLARAGRTDYDLEDAPEDEP
jgi:hypothetical protein